MDIKTRKHDEVWEVSFFEREDSFHLGIVIEEDYAYCTWIADMITPVKSMRMPDEFFDMIKDEYKLKRKPIEINLEEIEALPWEQR